MARPLRVNVPGGWYHVTSSGRRRQEIYYDRRDRVEFLRRLVETMRRFDVKVHAYVLMPSHRGKEEKAVEALALREPPAPVVKARLETLRRYAWSSFGIVAATGARSGAVAGTMSRGPDVAPTGQGGRRNGLLGGQGESGSHQRGS